MTSTPGQSGALPLLSVHLRSRGRTKHIKPTPPTRRRKLHTHSSSKGFINRQCAQVLAEQLAVVSAGERAGQVVTRTYQSLPHVQDGPYLLLQHLLREAQVLDLLVAKQ